ncbi:glycosyltransferase 87 family protein [Streptomyces sp. TS71-3]|uniref:glycosyltransferase 87 family protein n=1 Tax=Streptomyces sp. TS71-3 TaxID=2733862 RepID=UPI001B0A25F0|nr:glycosyltransferase 87 family protein [Streptomyces sp. TS71-3]GHJ40352.1 hypothetical protein Sm713_59610 [Streptomyces sp. TS71-3]
MPIRTASTGETPDGAPGALSAAAPHPAYRGACYALSTAVLSTLVYLAYRTADAWQFDLSVYRQGAAQVLHGAPLYRNDIDFTYPPFAALLLAPLALPGKALCAVLVLCASTALLHAAVGAFLGHAGWPAPRVRHRAVIAFSAAFVWLFPGRTSLMLGQVTFLILAVTAWDLTRPDGSRAKGVGIGLMAGLKLIPGIFAVYYLCTGRRVPALVAAGTFVATAAVGWLVLPGDSADYWTRYVFASDRIGAPQTADSETIRSLLVRAVHGTQGTTLPYLLAAVAVLAAGLLLARRCRRHGEELLGITVPATLMLLVLPVAWTFYWTWALVPLMLRLTQLAAVDRSRPAAAFLLILLALFAPDTVTRIRAGEAELTLATGDQLLAATHAAAAVLVLAMTAWLVRGGEGART